MEKLLTVLQEIGVNFKEVKPSESFTSANPPEVKAWVYDELLSNNEKLRVVLGTLATKVSSKKLQGDYANLQKHLNKLNELFEVTGSGDDRTVSQVGNLTRYRLKFYELTEAYADGVLSYVKAKKVSTPEVSELLEKFNKLQNSLLEKLSWVKHDAEVLQGKDVSKEVHTSLLSGNAFYYDPVNEGANYYYYFFHENKLFRVQFSKNTAGADFSFKSQKNNVDFSDYETFRLHYTDSDKYGFEDVLHKDSKSFWTKLFKCVQHYSKKSGGRSFTFEGIGDSSATLPSKVKRQRLHDATEHFYSVFKAQLLPQGSTLPSSFVLENVNKRANVLYKQLRTEVSLHKDEYEKLANSVTTLRKLTQYYVNNKNQLVQTYSKHYDYKKINIFLEGNLFEGVYKKASLLEKALNTADFNLFTLLENFTSKTELSGDKEEHSTLSKVLRTLGSLYDEVKQFQESTRLVLNFTDTLTSPQFRTSKSVDLKTTVTDEEYSDLKSVRKSVDLQSALEYCYAIKLLLSLQKEFRKSNKLYSLKELQLKLNTFLLDWSKSYSTYGFEKKLGRPNFLQELVNNVLVDSNKGFEDFDSNTVTPEEFEQALRSTVSTVLKKFPNYYEPLSPALYEKKLRYVVSQFVKNNPELLASKKKLLRNLVSTYFFLPVPLSPNRQSLQAHYRSGGSLLKPTEEFYMSKFNKREKLYYLALRSVFGKNSKRVRVYGTTVVFKLGSKQR